MSDLAGDVCVLISESPEAGQRDKWHESLRDRFGGTCTTPIHVTLQRIPSGQISAGIDITDIITTGLSQVQALSIQGVCVEARYSAFRSGWIAKLQVAAGKHLTHARTALCKVLESNDLRGVIPEVADGEPVPVTVLESMDPPDSRWQLSADPPRAFLPEPARISLDTITISRIRAAFDYEIIESWDLA